MPKSRPCRRCANTKEKRMWPMFFLEALNRIASIFAGIVGSLVGITTLAEKCKPYIKRRKAETEKDPSACLPASDGSNDDCTSNQ